MSFSTSQAGTGEAGGAELRRVLVVDDNEDSAMTMVMLLEVADTRRRWRTMA
jgi:hypoxanthine phosphoribosyltransferase